MNKNLLAYVCCECRMLGKRKVVETEWFSSILVVVPRPIFGELSHSLGRCKFVIKRIGCVLAAVMFVNHPLLCV